MSTRLLTRLYRPAKVYVVSFVIGGLAVVLLGRETKGRPLIETIAAQGS